MVSFDLRPRLGAINVLLLIVAVCVLRPGAAQSKAGAEPEEELTRIAADILEAQTHGGTYAKELIEPLTELSSLYQETGDHALELAALEQARQVVRANYGLSSLEQAPLMREQIRAEESRGNFKGAWELEQALLSLAHKNPDDTRAVPIYHEIGDKRMELMESYVAGERRPQFYLGCFYQVPGQVHGDPDDCTSGSRGEAIAHIVWDARHNYANAIGVLRRQQEPSSEERYELRELENKLLRNSYLLGDYQTGRRSLVRVIRDDNANSEPLMERIDRLVQLADWDLLYGRRTSAYDLYAKVHAYLMQQGVAQASIDELFAPSTPILLPTFRPSLFAPELAEGATGHVDVAFDIARFGTTSRINVLDTTSNTSSAAERQVTRWLVDHRFRPRLTDGQVVDTARIVARAYVHE
jgi:hypothetical protein